MRIQDFVGRADGDVNHIAFGNLLFFTITLEHPAILYHIVHLLEICVAPLNRFVTGLHRLRAMNCIPFRQPFSLSSSGYQLIPPYRTGAIPLWWRLCPITDGKLTTTTRHTHTDDVML